MSTPHIAWAFAQRNLTAAQRVVLIALAERANGERTCFPSEQTLAGDCELSRRSVIAAVQYLRAERGLIELVSDPSERAEILGKAGARKTARVNVYRILRPADGEKSAHTNGAKSAHSHQGNGAKSALSTDHEGAKYSHNRSDGAKSALSGDFNGAKSASRECKKRHIEGAPFAHEPLNESLQEKKREDRNAGKQEEPRPPPKAPVLGATAGGDSAYIAPTPARSSDAFLDNPSPDDALPKAVAKRAATLAMAGADAVTTEVPEPDQPVNPQAFQALIGSLARGWQNNYPPRLTQLTAAEQRDVCQPPPRFKASRLTPEQLAAVRRIAGIAA